MDSRAVRRAEESFMDPLKIKEFSCELVERRYSSLIEALKLA